LDLASLAYATPVFIAGTSIGISSCLEAGQSRMWRSHKAAHGEAGTADPNKIGSGQSEA